MLVWRWVQFEGHSGRVRTMSVSVDGQYLVTGSDDNTVRLWEVRHYQFLTATMFVTEG